MTRPTPDECQWQRTAEAYAPSRQKAVELWNTRASCRPADQVPDMVPGQHKADCDNHWCQGGDDCKRWATLQAVPATSGEPTEAMVKAGYDAAKKDGLTGPRKDCEQLVRLILTAALQSAPAASEVGERDA